MHSHARRALAAGATAGQVRHVAALAARTLGFPGAVAAFTWIEDVRRRRSLGGPAIPHETGAGGAPMAAKTVSIRRLEREDFTAVVAIDERITGHPRHDYWRDRFETAESIRPPWASMVAELDGRVVGFLLGWSSGWEFGIRGSVGWIDVIGVDPPYRGRGVGRALVQAFADAAQELRDIKTIFTLVDSGDSQIHAFFGRLGFTPGKMLHLERGSTG